MAPNMDRINLKYQPTPLLGGRDAVRRAEAPGKELKKLLGRSLQKRKKRGPEW
jgi:hypothetical protein